MSTIVKCQNCLQEFTIEPEDFKFYEKVQVPPPSFCPECRMQRRFTWRNERTLYKRKCDFSSKEIITIYSPDKAYRVYEQKIWWSDKWEAMEYAQNYDFSKPFFEQFKELQLKTPRLAIYNVNSVDSEYTNQAINNRNCYLDFSIKSCEDSCYITSGNNLKNCFDGFLITDSEFLYECIDTERSSRSSFLLNCQNCFGSAFLYECKSCNDSIGGAGLRHQKFVFFGQNLSQEEFQKRKQGFNLGGYTNQLKAKELFQELMVKFPRRFCKIINGKNCIGDNIVNSKNIFKCFNSFNIENCRYSARIFKCKDMVDCYAVGDSELNYEGIGIEEVYGNKFCYNTLRCRDVEYCDFCVDCSSCFGCVGLKKKSYCILNKQYTKEEYEKMVPKIIEHMNEMPYVSKVTNHRTQSTNKTQNPEFKTQTREIIYRYGEFFPPELSPFAHNETIAQEYFPLTKEQALSQGYSWRNPEERNYQLTMKTKDIPDHIKDVSDSILDEVIECLHNQQCQENCTQAFRLIKPELEFLRKMDLPLPRLCPNCRHYERIKQRNPLKLWQRQCQCAGKASENKAYQNTIEHFHQDHPCPNEFETTYEPERKEIVYCEKCYLAEVV